MYGWRAKIGHVAPSRGDTLVYEFYQMLPTGFMILNSTGTIRQLVDADFVRQLQRIEEAAADLVDNKCDSIIIGGSPLFTKLGHGSDIEMGKKLSAQFRVPVAAGITGEVEALKSLKIKKLVVATPHEDTLNERMKVFLEASGFNVLRIQGYGVRKNADLTDMDEHSAYKIAKRLYEQAPEADGVFVPCPRWPTITDVDLLEREIGKPVVTSCQAYIWHALKLAKVKQEVGGYGRLMASLAD
ncbi:MAG: maleate cis-trans isomerase family protein [Candidatus Binatia bacterium]